MTTARYSGLSGWDMLVADGGEGGQLSHNAEDSCGYVWAVRPVADVFGELFFVSVGSCCAGFDGYARN